MAIRIAIKTRRVEPDVIELQVGNGEVVRLRIPSEGVQSGGETVQQPPVAKAGRKLLRYKTERDGRVCSRCAPWDGVLTTGDGSDGVPVIPVHPNCRCQYEDTDLDTSDRDAVRRGMAAHFDWLKSLSRDDLAQVIGKVRADLVKGGRLTLRDLYDPDGNLRTMADLGRDERGRPIL